MVICIFGFDGLNGFFSFKNGELSFGWGLNEGFIVGFWFNGFFDGFLELDFEGFYFRKS